MPDEHMAHPGPERTGHDTGNKRRPLTAGERLDRADDRAHSEFDALSGISKTTLVAAIGILFLILRVFTVADWNWATAWTITTVTDFGDVIAIVAGTLFARPALTGALLAAVLPLLAIRLFWHMHGVRHRPITTGALLAVLGGWYASLLFSTDQWWTLLISLGVAVAVIVMRVIWHHGTFLHSLVKFLLARVGALATVAALILAVVVTEPWVPREAVVTADRTYTGYVLSVDNGFVQFLDDDRQMQAIPNALITERTEIAER